MVLIFPLFDHCAPMLQIWVQQTVYVAKYETLKYFFCVVAYLTGVFSDLEWYICDLRNNDDHGRNIMWLPTAIKLQFYVTNGSQEMSLSVLQLGMTFESFKQQKSMSISYIHIKKKYLFYLVFSETIIRLCSVTCLLFKSSILTLWSGKYSH